MALCLGDRREEPNFRRRVCWLRCRTADEDALYVEFGLNGFDASLRKQLIELRNERLQYAEVGQADSLCANAYGRWTAVREI